MNSSILVSKIQRVLDTDGRCGDGATVAKDYAAAIDQANRRLNTCMTYLAESQQSETIRIAEESPALLDECAKLAAVQVGPWLALCKDFGWPQADELNAQAIEKVNAIYASAAALEPLLKLYRKAVRTQDNFLVIKCLRRIIAMDKKSPTWKQDLASFEVKYMSTLKTQFTKASADGDKETMLRIAGEVEAEGWSVPVDLSLQEDIAALRKADREKQWQEQFQEDIGLIKKSYDAENFSQTLKFLGTIQGIEAQGFAIPLSEKRTLENISAWCQQIALEQERAATRSQLMAELHEAVELNDVSKIRIVLSSPECIDMVLDEDLESRARLVLRRYEMQRSRRRMQMCALIALMLMVVTVTAGVKYRQYCHQRDKSALIARLKLAYSQQDDKTMKQILDDAQTCTPKLYADNAVRIWGQRLTEISNQNASQRQSFDLILGGLQDRIDAKFEKCDDAAFQAELDKAKGLLLAGDLEREKRLAKIRVAFDAYQTEKSQSKEQQAAAQLTALLTELTAAQTQLKSEPMTDQVKAGAANLQSKLEAWKKAYAGAFPQLEVQSVAALESLSKSVQEAGAVLAQLDKIDSSTTLDEWAAARSILVQYCAVYPEVKPLQSLTGPYADALDGSLSVLRLTASEVQKSQGAVTPEIFQTVCKDIKDYENFEVQTAMYAIYPLNGSPKDAAIYSLNQPTLTEKPSATTAEVLTVITGSLFQPKAGASGFKDDSISTRSKVTFSKMPHCKYLEELIGKSAAPSITPDVLARFLMSEISRLSADPSFSDYKRVQLLNIYFGYLFTLTGLKGSASLQTFEDELQRLAQCLKFGKDENISWMLTNFKDIQDREKECSAFLRRSSDIMDRIHRALFSQALWALMEKQKVTFVGSARVRANEPVHFVDPKVSHGEVYALRVDGQTYRFYHVLTQEGSQIKLKAGALAPLPGEPLFVFKRGNLITSLPHEVESLRQQHAVTKEADAIISYPLSWPVGLETP